MDPAVSERFAQIQVLADAILERLCAEVSRLGFDPAEVPLPAAADADFRLERDPADGGYSLVGEWRDARGGKRGGLLFHADGSFFVEHDIVRNHPTKGRWFVEAVNAWGRNADIKVEARLLPLPE